jgi:hypothetical protein
LGINGEKLVMDLATPFNWGSIVMDLSTPFN